MSAGMWILEEQVASCPRLARPLDRTADLGAWARLSEAVQRGVQGGTDQRLDVSLNVLLTELEVVREVIRRFGVTITFKSESFRTRVTKLGRDKKAREAALTAPAVNSSGSFAVLLAAGCGRDNPSLRSGENASRMKGLIS